MLRRENFPLFRKTTFFKIMETVLTILVFYCSENKILLLDVFYKHESIFDRNYCLFFKSKIFSNQICAHNRFEIFKYTSKILKHLLIQSQVLPIRDRFQMIFGSKINLLFLKSNFIDQFVRSYSLEFKVSFLFNINWFQ